jgi:hypothetical protein
MGQAKSLEFSGIQHWEVRSPSVVLQIPEHMVLYIKPKAPIHPAIAFSEQFWKEQV